jgi:hypothetical protein
MKKLISTAMAIAIGLTAFAPATFSAQRKKVVVHKRPHRTTLVVRRNYPIRRRLPATVVVRPARRPVVVSAPLVYLPAVTWTSSVATLPARDRLVWEDSETIESEEGWVDANFGVDGAGDALLLEVKGTAELNFAEVAFGNGNVQVVDFNEKAHGTGLYKLLDFADGRQVKTVRIVALSNSEKTKLTVYLSK